MLSLTVIASSSAAAQDRSPAPTLVVFPFTTAGYRADTSALRKSAERVVEHLNGVLRADSTVRWLVYQPMRRPRDPRTGLIIAARYGVVGSVRPARADSLWVRFELVSIETMELLLRDSLQAGISDEAARAAPMAGRILGALREAEACAALRRLRPGESCP